MWTQRWIVCGFNKLDIKAKLSWVKVKDIWVLCMSVKYCKFSTVVIFCFFHFLWLGQMWYLSEYTVHTGDTWKKNPEQIRAKTRNSVHTGHKGSLKGMMSMKMMRIACYGFHNHQLNTYGRFWSNALESTLHHHYQNTNDGICLGRMVLNPPVKFHTQGEYMTRSTEAVPEARGGVRTNALYVSFPYIVTHMYFHN